MIKINIYYISLIQDIYDGKYCEKVFDLINEKYNIYEECESIFYETDWQDKLYNVFKNIEPISIYGFINIII